MLLVESPPLMQLAESPSLLEWLPSRAHLMSKKKLLPKQYLARRRSPSPFQSQNPSISMISLLSRRRIKSNSVQKARIAREEELSVVWVMHLPL